MRTVSFRFNKEEVPSIDQLTLKEQYVVFEPKIRSTFREEKDEFEFCLYPNRVNEHSKWIDEIKL